MRSLVAYRWSMIFLSHLAIEIAVLPITPLIFSVSFVSSRAPLAPPRRAMTAAGVSPSSSPRLPSPPPFPEVQVGPQSPSTGESFSPDGDNLLVGASGADDGSTRRIRPGTKAADMAFGPPLIPLSQVGIGCPTSFLLIY